MEAQSFEGEIQAARGGGAYVAVPFDVAEVFGQRGTVRVRGRVDDFEFESSVAPMGGGQHVLGLHKATREAIGKGIGDKVHVVIERDTRERVVSVPPDLDRALDASPAARENFNNFAFTHRKEYVAWIESAKRQETRERRIAQAIEKLADGKKLS